MELKILFNLDSTNNKESWTYLPLQITLIRPVKISQKDYLSGQINLTRFEKYLLNIEQYESNSPYHSVALDRGDHASIVVNVPYIMNVIKREKFSGVRYIY